MTAPVTAILATLTDEEVACDAVHSYGEVFLSSMRLRGQLSGSGWRGRPAVVVSGGNDLGFTPPRSRKRLQVLSVDRWVPPRLHPWCSLVSPPLLGWSSALRAERVFPG